MRSSLITVILFFLVFNLYGQEKQQYYKELKKRYVDEHYSEYSIEVPENWFSYRTDPGLIAHSPNQFKDSVHPFTNLASIIVRTNRSNKKNADKALKSYISSQKRNYGEFNYKLIEAEHKLYGKIYMLRYFVTSKKVTTVRLTAIINWKRKNYFFYFSSREFYYDKYALDVLKMINSFKVKE